MDNRKAWTPRNPGAASAAVFSLLALGALAPAATAQGFKYWDPEKGTPPATLSATGLYQDIAKGVLIPAARPFEVNSALWSDGSHKKRWVLLKAGTSIGFRETDDYWDYPDAAVFVKQFDIDTVAGDSASRIRWETRLLVNKKEPDFSTPGILVDRWYGFSYRWRRDGKDAELVADTGVKASVRVWTEGVGKGKPSRMKKWVFPSRDMCMNCHRTEQAGDTHGRSVLGFFTAQLNRPSAQDPKVNQLEALFAAGTLTGTRPKDFGSSPRWVGMDAPPEPKGTPAAAVQLERKSRSYIAANCSGCHGARGLEVGATFGVNFNFDFHTEKPAMRMQYTRVSWDFGLADLPPLVTDSLEDSVWGVSLLTPRFPQKSVILFRQRQRNTAPPDDITAYDPDRNQMPPMGSFEVNQAATAVIEEWIRTFPARMPVSARKHGLLAAREQPVLQGRRLRIPASLLQGRAEVSLLGLDGRKASLTRLGEGEYAVDPSTPRGVYILRAGSEKYTRSLW